ncbi:MAG: hypothetical protein VYB09_09025 [Planctomycetota bacterium]|nr:hypothetical protein [Planctomycetota bacterium]
MITLPVRHATRGLLLAFLAVLAACSRAPAPQPRAELAVDQVPIVLQLDNLPEGVRLHSEQPWDRALRIHHVNSEGIQAPPVAGHYRFEGNRVEFRPAFPLLPGQQYTGHFHPAMIPELAGLTEPVEVPFTTPGIPGPQTTPRILSIYPSGDLLPANHLKFYVFFSEPMRQGDIFGYFSLLDRTTGKHVPRPFRHTELWSPDEQRLTLWFHPGRQKTGVNLNVELGAILQQGHQYELQINPEWTSRKGVPLAEGAQKSFRSGPPDHQQPDPKHWLLTLPAAGSRSPLRCDMLEPLDWSLAHRVIHVRGPMPEKERLDGETTLDRDNRVLQFTPRARWSPGDYQLAVGVILEDLAGNSVARPFEVDVTSEKRDQMDPGSYRLIDFTIKTAIENP